MPIPNDLVKEEYDEFGSDFGDDEFDEGDEFDKMDEQRHEEWREAWSAYIAEDE